MGKFEMKIRKVLQYFPTIWLRYEEQILLFDTKNSNIHNFMSFLSKRITFIKLITFTGVGANAEQQPFLDFMNMKVLRQ